MPPTHRFTGPTGAYIPAASTNSATRAQMLGEGFEPPRSSESYSVAKFELEVQLVSTVELFVLLVLLVQLVQLVQLALELSNLRSLGLTRGLTRGFFFSRGSLVLHLP